MPSDQVSTSRESVKVQIIRSLKDADVPSSDLKNPFYKQSDTAELVDHFIEVSYPWFGSTESQRIMQYDGLQLLLRAPYLLHGILSFSASHLSYLHHYNKKYCAAAVLHYQLSLISYQERLQKDVNSKNVDLLFGGCLLQSMMAFGYLFHEARDGPLDSDDKGVGLTWLRAMQGTKILYEREELRPYLTKSIWLPVFLESNCWEESFCNHQEDEEDSWAAHTSKALHRLFELDDSSIVDENPYRQPLALLCQLMRCESSHDNIGMFMMFSGKLPPEFIGLLENSDQKAMLIMGYWSALFGKIDQWWIVRSTKVECMRICEFLDKASDARIRDLLAFPAAQCGYTLKT